MCYYEVTLISIGLISIGQFLNGAIQTGLTKSSSHLKEVMKAMWKLFHDSPARRDEFIKVNGSAEFAHNFCPTRWTENQPVAEKAF